VDDHPVRKAATTGKRIEQQLVGVKLPSGGEIIWMLISAEPILKDDGKNEKIICTYHDITKLKEAEKSVKEIKDKLDIALGIGNIGVWDWNLKTDKVIWDERLETMFGLKTGTFGKTFQSFVNLVNEEDIPHIKKSIKAALEKNLPLETIFRTSTKTGKTKYISLKGLVTKDKEGNSVSISGVCFDVTGLKEGTELLISKLNEELLRSNNDLQSFAYVASHDLQEPLRMVTSFTQLLSKRYGDKLDENAKEYINFAVDGAKRMHDLLSGLLAYSRINTKAQEFRRVDLNDVLSSVTKNLSLLIKERRTVIHAPKLPVVFTDECQMIQLFQNLISNSIKFSTGSPKIFISVKNQIDQFVFSFKDEGIGIEPKYFERIFLIFQRIFPREKYEGTGIGLAVCKRIVERHGGKIWVESEPEKGSTFIFTIPNKIQL
jgi:PAS domain-containing protein